MSLPVPPPATRASPPIGTRSDRQHYLLPSASVCPRSAWSRWWPSSPRGSTRREKKTKFWWRVDQPTAGTSAWMSVNETSLSHEEREWWETALDRPLKIFFFCLYDLPISMINYCVWVSCMQSMCLRRKHFGKCNELLRLGEITQTSWVDGRSFRAPMETRVDDESIINQWSSRTHARLASLI